MQFSELGIKPTLKSFTGEKIRLEKILNIPVEVEYYEIEESKFKEKGNGKRLKLQLDIKGERRIVFTGSTFLMDMISRVPNDAFPLETTIIKVNDHYEFS